MKRLFIIGACCLVANANAQEQTWVGQYTIDARSTAVVLHDRSQTVGAASVLDIPALGARDIALTNFSRGRFNMQGGPDQYAFRGAVHGREMAGSVTRGAARGRFKLVQLAPLDPAQNRALSGSYQIAPDHVIDIGVMGELGGQLVFLDHKTLRTGPLQRLAASRFVAGPAIGVVFPFTIEAQFTKNAQGAVTGLRWKEGRRSVSARKIAPYHVQEVTVVNGAVTLKGTLAIPDTPGPHPAVVLAHGAGDALRDVGPWNTFFLRQGMAVLSLDKRGAGDSGGDWRQADMDDIAGDWLAGVAMLRVRSDIDPHRIGVHGSSQGGWTAPLMAVRSPDVAWIIVRAGSATSVGDTMVHEIGWSVREAGLPESDAQEAQAAARRLFALSGAPWDVFDAYAATLKQKRWAPHVWPLHQSKDGWGRGWNRINAPYDPAATLAQVKVPMLWFLGQFDHNVPSAESAQRLTQAQARSGNQDISVITLGRSGHAFLNTATGNNSEFPTRTQMAAGYWNAMEDWLRARGFSQP